ncbi:MAG TPA: Ig-like domain-containing protein, partial [Acidimicrobiales bacterium]
VYLADVTTVTGSFSLRNFGEGQTYEGTVSADPTTGAFSLTLASPVTAGQVYTSDATDGLGNTSEFGHDIVAGGPSTPVGVTAPPYISQANSTAVTVSGSSPTSAVSATITLTDQASATVTSTVSVDGSGNFTTTLDASSLADGPVTASVFVTDAASQTSPTVTLASTKDTISPVLQSTSPAASSTVASPGTISFSYSEPLASGASVAVTLDGTPVPGVSAIPGDPAAAVFTPTSPIGSGALEATSTVTDLAGNPTVSILDATVDATPPDAPTLTTPDTANGIDQVAVPVSGTAEPLAVLDLTATDGTNTTTTITSADATGAYATTIDMSALVDGSISVSVVAVDAVGNVSPATTNSLVKNSNGPKLVSSTPVLGTTVASPGTVRLTFDRGLGVGSMISLSNGVSNVFGQSVVSGQSVVFTPLSSLDSGTYTASATAVDSFANATAVQVGFTIDATPPAAPSVTPPASVDFNSAPADPFGGTAEPGSTVAVTVTNGSTTVQGSTTADPSGNWSLNLDVSTLADGSLSVSATATDAVGNVSTPTTLTVAKQTLPSAPAISGVVATATQLTVNVVAPANTGGLPIIGYRVTLASTGPTVTFSSTTASVVSPVLPQGTSYSVTAQAQTAAGYGPASSSIPTATKFTPKITIVPAAKTVAHGGTLSFSGVITRATAGTPIKGAKAILWQVDTLGHKVEAGRMTATNAAGQWSLTITPPTGTWKYYATWAGDATDVFCQSTITVPITVS